MQRFQGTLLIGGMALESLDGEFDGDPDGETGRWAGRFLVDRSQVRCLQTGRPYLLELSDGRSGQVIVSRMEEPVGHLKLLVEFDGTSPLTPSRWQRVPR